MFDEAIQKVRDAGYAICYSNDCAYPCLKVRVFNGEKSRERMIDHRELSDEDNIAKVVLEMLDELESEDVETN